MLDAKLQNSQTPPARFADDHRVRPLSALFLTLFLSLPSIAYADATVVVEVKRPDGSAADGVVQLTQGASRLRCTTTKGRCEIKGVAGGVYTVELEQAGRPASRPKTVMIPPSGEVKLIVAAS